MFQTSVLTPQRLCPCAPLGQRSHPGCASAGWASSGLTLIETLISLMLFSVGMLGLAGLTTVIVHHNTLSQQLTTATILAQDQLEALQTRDYLSVESTQDLTISNRNIYDRTMEVQDNYPTAGMKTVAITITWGPETDQHQVTLKTIITAKN